MESIDRFSIYRECTAPVEKVELGGYPCIGSGGIWGISVPSCQFYYKYKNIYNLL